MGEESKRVGEQAELLISLRLAPLSLPSLLPATSSHLQLRLSPAAFHLLDPHFSVCHLQSSSSSFHPPLPLN